MVPNWPCYFTETFIVVLNVVLVKVENFALLNVFFGQVVPVSGQQVDGVKVSPVEICVQVKLVRQILKHRTGIQQADTVNNMKWAVAFKKFPELLLDCTRKDIDCSANTWTPNFSLTLVMRSGLLTKICLVGASAAL